MPTDIHIDGLVQGRRDSIVNALELRISCTHPSHYGDVIMGAMASRITSLTSVCSTVYSGADQRKHQSSALLAFVRGIHRWPVNSPHKGPVTRKIFPFDAVIKINGDSRRHHINDISHAYWANVIHAHVFASCQAIFRHDNSCIRQPVPGWSTITFLYLINVSEYENAHQAYIYFSSPAIARW